MLIRIELQHLPVNDHYSASYRLEFPPKWSFETINTSDRVSEATESEQTTNANALVPDHMVPT